jgi:hypothetical protein
MLRNSLAFTIRWSASGVWLGVLVALLAGCSQAPDSRPSSASVEQTTSDNQTHVRVDSPVLERQRHLTDLGALLWHQQGVRGQGVKIAILDSGFRDHEKFLGQGLPARVKVRSFRKDGNLEARDSQHGLLCGEVLHAVAPDAELLLVNWEPDSPRTFVDAVRWVKSQGARIISCSLIMPSWSDGEGGGAVHRDLQKVLGDGDSPHDLLCFASAGNTAERHWSGLYAPDKDGWHCWQPGATANGLQPWGAERVAVEFYGPLQSSYELRVHREGTGALIGTTVFRTDATKSGGRAVVRFEPDPRARYQVRVRCLDERPAGNDEAFHLFVLGGSLSCTTSHGSIPFPGDGAHVTAVGAVDQNQQRASYSSCGPNSTLPKPDFVATVPFPSLCRERPFAGTSAAAPQAAGLAALLWSRHPDWTPNQVLQAMREAAVDLGPPGHDCETGYGLIRLR